MRRKRNEQSGYTDECDGWELVRWRGAVNSAIRGKRGQAFLNEMVTALDAMQEKRLVSGLLETGTATAARSGAVGLARSMDLTQIDPDDRETVARTFQDRRGHGCRDHVRQRRRRGRFCLGES